VLQRFKERGSRHRPRPDEPMTLVDHLAELRRRIVISMIAIALGAVGGFLLYNPVLEILQRPYCEISEQCSFIVTDPLEGFSIRLKVSTYIGFLIASPIVLWQVWRFVTPGLHPNEKRYAVPFVFSSVILFLGGALVALATFPEALKFLSAIAGESVEPLYSPGKYISLIVFMMAAFGLGFEFPVLLVFLEVAGILHWRQLLAWWRYAIVLIFVVDAVITPSQDPISLLALGVPMCLFYAASIAIGWLIQRNRDRPGP
jgi:sec-independent protein translocase protein TatC